VAQCSRARAVGAQLAESGQLPPRLTVKV